MARLTLLKTCDGEERNQRGRERGSARAMDHDRKEKGAAELAPAQAALRSPLTAGSQSLADPWSGTNHGDDSMEIKVLEGAA